MLKNILCLYDPANAGTQNHFDRPPSACRVTYANYRIEPTASAEGFEHVYNFDANHHIVLGPSPSVRRAHWTETLILFAMLFEVVFCRPNWPLEWVPAPTILGPIIREIGRGDVGVYRLAGFSGLGVQG